MYKKKKKQNVFLYTQIYKKSKTFFICRFHKKRIEKRIRYFLKHGKFFHV